MLLGCCTGTKTPLRTITQNLFSIVLGLIWTRTIPKETIGTIVQLCRELFYGTSGVFAN